MPRQENYNLLINKLEAFIRKYYQNKLLRGAIYAATILLASYLLIALLEHYNYYHSTTRLFLFYSFLFSFLFILYRFVASPLLGMYRLGRKLNHEQAAVIIGEHFPEVKDKLLNTLNLHKALEQESSSNALLEAAIDQKIDLLKPIPFSSVINLQANRKYLRYLILPVAVIIGLLLISPEILTGSTRRLVHYDTFYEKQAPFQFNIQNASLSTLQNEDFVLELKMTGSEIPQDIYLVTDDHSFKLEKENIIQFQYQFKNPQKAIPFRLQANGYTSKEYVLDVLPKPSVLHFTASLDYPAYTGKADEQLQNVGEFSVPEGTRIRWDFATANVNQLQVTIDGKQELAQASKEGVFQWSKQLFKTCSYSLKPGNDRVQRSDSITYVLQVVPDAYPSIQVQERIDSNSSKSYYFIGQVQDDYGFKRLSFQYRFANKPGSKLQSVDIPFDKKNTSANFFYFWDLGQIDVQPGDVIDYYFEVFDNDGVNGSKSVRSETRTFKAPSEKELEKELSASSEALKQKMEQAAREAAKLQEQSKKLREQLQDKKNLSFNEKKAIQDLIDKQKELEKLAEEIRKEHEQQNKREEEYHPSAQEKKDEQKKIDDLLKNLEDEKTKNLLEQLQKLLQQEDKAKTQEKLEEFQSNNRDLQKELERTLELYKKMEVEQQLKKNIEQLDKLAGQQQKLAQDTKDKKAPAEELKKQQDALNKDFEDLKKSMQDLEKKNQELESPANLEKTDQEQQNISEEMKNSSEELQQGKNSKASQSQQNAGKQMEQLSQKMQQMQQEMEAQELEINMKALRDLLENLIKVSFDQEAVMNELKKTTPADPQYKVLSQRQTDLKDNLKMVEDSLFELSKKVQQIQATVNKEIADIHDNSSKVLQSLSDRKVGEATNRQQYVMTSVNNLAVLLSEAYQQMQQQMMQMKMKSGSGKPGQKKGEKPGMDQLSKMQEELNKQLQQMKGSMKQGGKGEGQGQQGKMSEQLAKMAREQQAIRNALEQISKEDNKDGKGGMGNLDKLAKDMEKTEKDIYNKILTEETLRRQQDILTRLLDADKAQKERENEERREAKQGKDQSINYNIVFEEYKKMKLKELELVKTLPPQLNQFYKDRVNQYFQKVGNSKIN